MNRLTISIVQRGSYIVRVYLNNDTEASRYVNMKNDELEHQDELYWTNYRVKHLIAHLDVELDDRVQVSVISKNDEIYEVYIDDLQAAENDFRVLTKENDNDYVVYKMHHEVVNTK